MLRIDQGRGKRFLAYVILQTKLVQSHLDTGVRRVIIMDLGQDLDNAFGK